MEQPNTVDATPNTTNPNKTDVLAYQEKPTTEALMDYMHSLLAELNALYNLSLKALPNFGEIWHPSMMQVMIQQYWLADFLKEIGDTDPAKTTFVRDGVKSFSVASLSAQEIQYGNDPNKKYDIYSAIGAFLKPIIKGGVLQNARHQSEKLEIDTEKRALIDQATSLANSLGEIPAVLLRIISNLKHSTKENEETSYLWFFLQNLSISLILKTAIEASVKQSTSAPISRYYGKASTFLSTSIIPGTKLKPIPAAFERALGNNFLYKQHRIELTNKMYGQFLTNKLGIKKHLTSALLWPLYIILNSPETVPLVANEILTSYIIAAPVRVALSFTDKLDKEVLETAFIVMLPQILETFLSENTYFQPIDILFSAYGIPLVSSLNWLLLSKEIMDEYTQANISYTDDRFENNDVTFNAISKVLSYAIPAIVYYTSYAPRSLTGFVGLSMISAGLIELLTKTKCITLGYFIYFESCYDPVIKELNPLLSEYYFEHKTLPSNLDCKDSSLTPEECKFVFDEAIAHFTVNTITPIRNQIEKFCENKHELPSFKEIDCPHHSKDHCLTIFNYVINNEISRSECANIGVPPEEMKTYSDQQDLVGNIN